MHAWTIFGIENAEKYHRGNASVRLFSRCLVFRTPILAILPLKLVCSKKRTQIIAFLRLSEITPLIEKVFGPHDSTQAFHVLIFEIIISTLSFKSNRLLMFSRVMLGVTAIANSTLSIVFRLSSLPMNETSVLLGKKR